MSSRLMRVLTAHLELLLKENVRLADLTMSESYGLTATEYSEKKSEIDRRFRDTYAEIAELTLREASQLCTGCRRQSVHSGFELCDDCYNMTQNPWNGGSHS